MSFVWLSNFPDIWQDVLKNRYKLNIFISEYVGEFYNNKPDLNTADVIQVQAESDTIEFINFVVSRVVGVQDGYEPNAVYEEAFEIMVGQNITPQINPAGDIDFSTIFFQGIKRIIN